MNVLDALLKYFPTGTAEGEQAVLGSVFIVPEQMADVISAPPGSPRLMVGSKGVGKSAILDQILRSCLDEKIPALLLRPDNIDLSPVKDAKDIGTLKRQMYECLLTSLAASLGKMTNGLLSGDALELHKAAIKTGIKRKDLVQRLVPVLAAIATPVAGLDATRLATSLTSGNAGPLLPAVEGYLLSAQSIAILLMDDTDQLGSPDEPGHLNRLWAFLLAVRRLTQEVPAIHAIVSLRSEVWLRLQRDERGQRDQIDHFRPLVVDLRVNDEHLRRILERRFQCAAVDLKSPNRLLQFFENEDMILPKSNESRPWIGFITKSARERPRDVVQLVHLLATNAK